MKRLLFALLLTLLFIQPAFAVEPDEMLKNPVLEARARAIGHDLRCLVCQGEDIDSSASDFAHDLRVLVRQRLKAGDTDDQVRQYLRARYGDYILMKPPLEDKTLLLWLMPLLVTGAGLAVTGTRIRRKKP